MLHTLPSTSHIANTATATAMAMAMKPASRVSNGARLTLKSRYPIRETRRRLHEALGYDPSTHVRPEEDIPKIFANGQRAFDRYVQQYVGRSDFMVFSRYPYDPLMTYNKSRYPATTRYIIGNPLLARNVAQHDPQADLHVPVALLLSETQDGTCEIVWDRPSSVILPSRTMSAGSMDVEAGSQLVGSPRVRTHYVSPENTTSELRQAVEVEDGKLESLVRHVTGN